MTAAFAVGHKLPNVVMVPSAVQLFRYSAVTWNAHRVHYDQGWAAHEGHAGLLVHSHLHAANALRVLTDGLGTGWRIVDIAYRIIRPSTAGHALTATAEVTEVADEGGTLVFRLVELNDEGEPCLEGTARATRT